MAAVRDRAGLQEQRLGPADPGRIAVRQSAMVIFERMVRSPQ